MSHWVQLTLGLGQDRTSEISFALCPINQGNASCKVVLVLSLLVWHTFHNAIPLELQSPTERGPSLHCLHFPLEGSPLWFLSFILRGLLEELKFCISELIWLDYFRRYDREYYPDICSHFCCDTVFINRCDFSERRSEKNSVNVSYVAHTEPPHCLPNYKAIVRSNQMCSYWSLVPHMKGAYKGITNTARRTLGL